MADKIYVFASFKPADGKESEVESVLRGMCAPTRNEPGNEIYDLHVKTAGSDDGPSFHLFERYSDAAALDAHRETEHYKNYRAAIMDLLGAPIHVVVMEGVNVAG
ncbi:MAG: antibiotic biosynthesis monooxygenase [Rhodospirillaceae bacterium]|nr:antibiotic biosynthesis monooxygenase [Rhodospirillaceae bacterium]|tara:strand:+ start:594 stop:908 length:315 start_codon:yes stop_codon:yes gene_type:complete